MKFESIEQNNSKTLSQLIVVLADWNGWLHKPLFE